MYRPEEHVLPISIFPEERLLGKCSSDRSDDLRSAQRISVHESVPLASDVAFDHRKFKARSLCTSRRIAES